MEQGITGLSCLLEPALFRKRGLVLNIQQNHRISSMKYDNRPIGVFDSGLGGLTAFKELRQQLPQEDIIYFGDTGRLPYGTKSRETIIRYASQDVDFLLQHQVKMIIAACGTVSANIPKDFTKFLPVPFTGVVTHTCAAACAAAKGGHIGVIATPATIRSGAYEMLIHSISPEAKVTSAACPLFVPLVESGFIQRDNPVTRLIVEQYLSPLRCSNVDVLILGCTHYPLLADVIGDYMGESVTLIDSGRSAALYAKDFLSEQGLLASQDKGPGTNHFYVSDSAEDFSEVASVFLGEAIRGEVSRVAVG